MLKGGVYFFSHFSLGFPPVTRLHQPFYKLSAAIVAGSCSYGRTGMCCINAMLHGQQEGTLNVLPIGEWVWHEGTAGVVEYIVAGEDTPIPTPSWYYCIRIVPNENQSMGKV